MQFPARRDALPQMLHFLLDAGRGCGLKAKDLHRLELASEEALINIITHAFSPSAPEPLLEIEWRKLPSGGIEVILSDRGEPFDPTTQAPEPPNKHLSIEERPIGGLGIYLLRKSVDALSYRREGGMNVLTFVVEN